MEKVMGLLEQIRATEAGFAEGLTLARARLAEKDICCTLSTEDDEGTEIHHVVDARGAPMPASFARLSTLTGFITRAEA
tara:strand:+ start:408 stop:644 length:237 start_codon:yes stop_codon:yes gene_type:complete